MAQKRITISSTDEFERKVSKFIHSQKLKGVKINRSSLDREGVEIIMAIEKRVDKEELLRMKNQSSSSL